MHKEPAAISNFIPNLIVESKDWANNLVKDSDLALQGFVFRQVVTVAAVFHTCRRIHILLRMPRRDQCGEPRRRSV